MLKKEIVLYDRNSNGELIPKEVELEVDEDDSNQLIYKGQTVCVVPMTRGDLKEYFAKAKFGDSNELENELILKYCRNPVFTSDEVKVLKPGISICLINTIFRESGLDIGKKSIKKAMIDAEDDFAKN